ncbi:MAG: hypothetical protein JWO94_3248 [Verrucomicrobiaceae bacterium]|nr:hypothetical protein [Verrucomicrobiaceae bacterium]
MPWRGKTVPPAIGEIHRQVRDTMGRAGIPPLPLLRRGDTCGPRPHNGLRRRLFCPHLHLRHLQPRLCEGPSDLSRAGLRQRPGAGAHLARSVGWNGMCTSHGRMKGKAGGGAGEVCAQFALFAFRNGMRGGKRVAVKEESAHSSRFSRFAVENGEEAGAFPLSSKFQPLRTYHIILYYISIVLVIWKRTAPWGRPACRSIHRRLPRAFPSETRKARKGRTPPPRHLVACETRKARKRRTPRARCRPPATRFSQRNAKSAKSAKSPRDGQELMAAGWRLQGAAGRRACPSSRLQRDTTLPRQEIILAERHGLGHHATAGNFKAQV